MPHQTPPRFLATKGPLGLQRFAEVDLDALFDIESDPFLKRYVDRPVKAQRTEWISAAAKLTRSDIQYALEHIPSGALAGRVSLGHYGSTAEDREIQVILAKNFVGLGLGKVAVELTVGYTCGALRAKQIVAVIELTHAASIRLVTELGFSEVPQQQDVSGRIKRVFALPCIVGHNNSFKPKPLRGSA